MCVKKESPRSIRIKHSIYKKVTEKSTNAVKRTVTKRNCRFPAKWHVSPKFYFGSLGLGKCGAKERATSKVPQSENLVSMSSLN